jgi:mRNA interferase RelE/StbE
LAWIIEWDERAIKDAKKLGVQASREIVTYLKKRIATKEDPRRFGKALIGNKAGLWRYRVRDYRILCRIEEHRLIVLVLAVGHRKEVYD